MKFEELTPGQRVCVRLPQGKKSGTVARAYQSGESFLVIQFDSGEMGKITQDNCKFFEVETTKVLN